MRIIITSVRSSCTKLHVKGFYYYWLRRTRLLLCVWGGGVGRSRGRGRSGGAREQSVIESYTKKYSTVKI